MDEYGSDRLGFLMNILIETLTGTVFHLKVSPFETVISIKAKLQRLEGIPISQQNLIWNGTELEDDCCLYDYHIYNGATLTLVLGMRGGPVNTRRISFFEPSESPKDITDHCYGDDVSMSEETCLSPNCISPDSRSHVTLLVFRDGDQLNFYRIVDRGEGARTVTPAAESSSVSPATAAVQTVEPDGLVREKTENIATRQKMKELMLKINRAKLPKNGIANDSQQQLVEPLVDDSCATKFIPRPPSHSRTSAPRSTRKFHKLEGDASQSANLSNSVQDETVSLPEPPTDHIGEPISEEVGIIDSRLDNIVPPGTSQRCGSDLDDFRPSNLPDRSSNMDFCLHPLTPMEACDLIVNGPSPASGHAAQLVDGTPSRLGRHRNADGLNSAARLEIAAVATPQNVGRMLPSRPPSQLTHPGLSAAAASAAVNAATGAAASSVNRISAVRKLSSHLQRLGISSRAATSRLQASADPWAGLKPDKLLAAAKAASCGGNSGSGSGSGVSSLPKLPGVSSASGGAATSSGGCTPIAAAAASAAAATPADSPSVLAPTAKLPAPSSSSKAPAVRCAFCHRKTGIVGAFQCRCEKWFCTIHRYAESHNCRFDYKSEGRKLIQQSNPLVIAPKLPKI